MKTVGDNSLPPGKASSIWKSRMHPAAALAQSVHHLLCAVRQKTKFWQHLSYPWQLAPCQKIRHVCRYMMTPRQNFHQPGLSHCLGSGSDHATPGRGSWHHTILAGDVMPFSRRFLQTRGCQTLCWVLLTQVLHWGSPPRLAPAAHHPCSAAQPAPVWSHWVSFWLTDGFRFFRRVPMHLMQ